MDKEALERFNRIETMIEKSEKRHEKFQEYMKELGLRMKEFGGFVSNAGRETEELFIKSIEKNDLKIGDYQFDFLRPNVSARSKSIGEVEVDLLLLNTDILGLLEVKSTLHKNDVQEHFEKRLPKFRELFPEYKDKQIIGMVGGKVINTDAVKLAHDCGFVVLTPKEQGLKVDDEYARVLAL